MNVPGSEQPREYPDGRPLPDQPTWRQDFPTDVPDDNHVARREFVKFLVLTSGAFVAGQCWIAAASALREKGPLPRLRLATVAELETKRVVEFRYPDEHEPCLALCLAPNDRVPIIKLNAVAHVSNPVSDRFGFIDRSIEWHPERQYIIVSVNANSLWHGPSVIQLPQQPGFPTLDAGQETFNSRLVAPTRVGLGVN